MDVSLTDCNCGMACDFLDRKGIGSGLPQPRQKRVSQIIQTKLCQTPQALHCHIVLGIDRIVRNMVLNPLFHVESKEARQRLIDRLAKTMPDSASVEVRIKNQNTRRFLEVANAQCESFREKMSSLDAELAAARGGG